MSVSPLSVRYNSFGGETKSKFNFGSHRKSSTITEDQLFKWTSGNMYRTSYNEMANTVSKTIMINDFYRAHPLKEKTWQFQSTRDMFQI